MKSDQNVGKVLQPILDQVAEAEEKQVYLQDDKGNLFVISMCQQAENNQTVPETQPVVETKNKIETPVPDSKPDLKETKSEAKAAEFEYYDEEYASYESEEEKK